MGGSMSTLTHNSNSYCPRDGATNDLVKPTENGATNGGAAVSGDGPQQLQPEPDARTAFDLFLRGCRIAEDGPCLGTRASATSPYKYTTYNETLQEVQAIAAYLSRTLGLVKGDFVGTLSSNCANLAILELACYSLGLVIVPLYDTLGREACSHILEETGLRLVFCRTTKQLDTVRELAKELGTANDALRFIVSEPAVDNGDGGGQSADALADSFADAFTKGRDALAEADAAEAAAGPEPSDLAVICYTSGTTGQPKGVMLTNSNLVRGFYLVRATVKEDTFRNPVELNKSDVYFSYLPMAHILERMCQIFAFAQGVAVGFYRGDRTAFMDDLRTCRPTFLAAVPKVLSRVRERAMAAVAGSRLKSAVLSTALSRKGRRLAELRVDRSSMWDRLVFRKVQEGLGGRLRFVAVGGAPISPDTLQFVKAAFGCPVVQGFGQTETTGLGLCQRPGDPASDTTGAPMHGIEVKLIDAPEADCHEALTAGRGELCIRGPTCFSGYYRQPEKTAEALDAEGWVHTGDIAQVLPDGAYRIVDRVKHLFKLAQGEYIAPEKIELAYGLCPMVEQAFVDGRSERSCLLGVVVPTGDSVRAWAAKSGCGGGAEGDNNSLAAAACASPEFKAELLAAMQLIGRQKGLQGFELVKDILVHPEPFTAENDLLTPTMKLKRPQLRKKFAEAFDSMYQLIEG